MRRCIAVTCFAVALNLAACREQTATAPALRPVFDAGGGQSGMTLHPSGFGPHSYAAWKAHQGEPDGHGNADFALYFQKLTETAAFAAGVAVVDGLEGQPVATLDTLSWEHRADGHCGAGAPRWNVGITGASGTELLRRPRDRRSHPGASGIGRRGRDDPQSRDRLRRGDGRRGRVRVPRQRPREPDAVDAAGGQLELTSPICWAAHNVAR